MPGVLWRPCFAHTLQLCVNGALTSREVTDLPKILSKARSIVGHFRRSPTATSQLAKAQEQLSLPRHQLLQDCATRWNSQVSTNVFLWSSFNFSLKILLGFSLHFSFAGVCGLRVHKHARRPNHVSGHADYLMPAPANITYVLKWCMCTVQVHVYTCMSDINIWLCFSRAMYGIRAVFL